MAKVKYTAIVAQMSGKLAGSVFGRNRWGNYIRTLTSPLNPNTQAQQRVRALFGNTASAWYNLSDDQRTAWNSMSDGASMVGSMGSSFSYNGRTMFTHLNRYLQEINEAMLTAPPVLAPVEIFNTFSADIVTTPGSEEIKLNFTPAINADTKLIVYATKVLKRGVTYISNGLYKKIAVLDDTFLTGSSIETEYLSVFKTMPATGDRVAFKIRAVSIASGKPEYPLTDIATGTV